MEAEISTLLGRSQVSPKVWLLHGIPMAISVLLFFPLGAFMLQTGSPHSARYHAGIQLIGLVTALSGMFIGFFYSSGISVSHQYIGLGIATFLICQAILGWQHHQAFLRSEQKSWFTSAHVWLGRALLLGGWVNLLLGMKLRGYKLPLIMCASGAAFLQMLLIIFASYRRRVGKPIGT